MTGVSPSPHIRLASTLRQVDKLTDAICALEPVTLDGLLEYYKTHPVEREDMLSRDLVKQEKRREYDYVFLVRWWWRKLIKDEVIMVDIDNATS
jgi:hypothetical protein